jgi:tetratricopeptide (TPR) repeat protein
LELERLPPESAGSIVATLSAGTSLPAKVREQILSRSEGVPLFIEELTKAVIESEGVGSTGNASRAPISDQLRVPSSLEDSLTARLDRLAHAKEVAQVGAVIGRQFPHDLLATVMGVPENELAAMLERLIDTDLVHALGAPPQATYVFRHALIHDAAYSSLVRSRRQELHGRIARTIEEAFPATTQLYPEVLAHHYTQAAALASAVRYWELAGDSAARRFANAEAINHYSQGIALLRSLPSDLARKRQEFGLHAALGKAQIAAAGYASSDVGNSFSHAHQLFPDIAESSLKLPVLKGRAQHFLARARYRDAQITAEELSALAADAPDLGHRVDVHLVHGLTHLYQGSFASARACLERGMQALESNPGDPAAPSCAAYLARTLWFLGRADTALQTAFRALSLARGSDESGMSPALGMLAVVLHARGDLAAAQEWIQTTIAHAREKEHVYWVLLAEVLESWLQAHQEKTRSAAEAIAARIARYASNGSRLGLSWFLLLQAEAQAQIGLYDEAIHSVDSALQHVESTNENYYAAEVHRTRGELLLARFGMESAAEANTCFGRSLGYARAQGAMPWELRAAMSLARFGRRLRSGASEGENAVAAIYARFTEGHATADLRAAAAFLATAEQSGARQLPGVLDQTYQGSRPG